MYNVPPEILKSCNFGLEEKSFNNKSDWCTYLWVIQYFIRSLIIFQEEDLKLKEVYTSFYAFLSNYYFRLKRMASNF